jgi:hypothetical protein
MAGFSLFVAVIAISQDARTDVDDVFRADLVEGRHRPESDEVTAALWLRSGRLEAWATSILSVAILRDGPQGLLRVCESIGASTEHPSSRGAPASARLESGGVVSAL